MGKLSYNNGFTLIEILIIITVLGVLVGIVLPRLSGITDDARDEGLRTTAVFVKNSIELHLAEINQMPNSDDETFDFTNSSIDFSLSDSYEVEGLNSYDSTDSSYTINLYELDNGNRTGRSATITESSVSID
jgi:prepilin-type N-terminal cleavage/methylation domain-containing protein